MAKSPKEKEKKISMRKELYHQLTGQLTASLPTIKDLLGEKEFASRVKKAAKLLSQGIKQKAKETSKKVKENDGVATTKASKTPAEV